MATTKTSIGNSALRMIGKPRIDSFASGGAAGQILEDIYEDKVEDLLRKHLWNFAIKRASLNASATAPEWGFENSYLLPTDCIRVVSIEDDGYVYPEKWQVEGRYVVTDSPAPLKIKYIRRAAESEFDSSFKECLSSILAAEMAQALTGSQELQAEMQSEAERKFRLAKGADGQEGTPPTLKLNTWVRAKRNGANRDDTRLGS